MPLEIVFKDDKLRKLESDPSFEGGYSPIIIKAFRKRMQQIRCVLDERDFYNLKSLRFEKMKGNRAHQHSMRLNDQWRLILEIEGGNPKKTIKIISIEDYH